MIQPPAWTPEHLTPADATTLATYLGHPATLPPKDWDPAQTYARCTHCTDVRVMVAIAALTGRCTHLPPDPRLAPKPHAPLRHAPPKAATDATPPTAPQSRPRPATADWGPSNPAPDWVLTTLAPNPKKPNSNRHARYAKYRLGATVAELLAAGCRRRDFAWDLEHGYVAFTPPAPAKGD